MIKFLFVFLFSTNAFAGLVTSGNAAQSLTISTITSSVKTPAASNHYHSLTSNSITLTAGTWELLGSVNFSFVTSTPAYTDMGVGFWGANGADTSSAPVTALSGVSGLTINTNYMGGLAAYYNGSASSAQSLNLVPVVVTCTSSCVVYIVTYSTQTTSANARVTTYFSARRIY